MQMGRLADRHTYTFQFYLGQLNYVIDSIINVNVNIMKLGDTGMTHCYVNIYPQMHLAEHMTLRS